jgi:hypothetical protein
LVEAARAEALAIIQKDPNLLKNALLQHALLLRAPQMHFE